LTEEENLFEKVAFKVRLTWMPTQNKTHRGKLTEYKNTI
jgi:hypothetical protein